MLGVELVDKVFQTHPVESPCPTVSSWFVFSYASTISFGQSVQPACLCQRAANLLSGEIGMVAWFSSPVDHVVLEVSRL